MTQIPRVHARPVDTYVAPKPGKGAQLANALKGFGNSVVSATKDIEAAHTAIDKEREAKARLDLVTLEKKRDAQVADIMAQGKAQGEDPTRTASRVTEYLNVSDEESRNGYEFYDTELARQTTHLGLSANKRLASATADWEVAQAGKSHFSFMQEVTDESRELEGDAYYKAINEGYEAGNKPLGLGYKTLFEKSAMPLLEQAALKGDVRVFEDWAFKRNAGTAQSWLHDPEQNTAIQKLYQTAQRKRKSDLTANTVKQNLNWTMYTEDLFSSKEASGVELSEEDIVTGFQTAQRFGVSKTPQDQPSASFWKRAVAHNEKVQDLNANVSLLTLSKQGASMPPAERDAAFMLHKQQLIDGGLTPEEIEPRLYQLGRDNQTMHPEHRDFAISAATSGDPERLTEALRILQTYRGTARDGEQSFSELDKDTIYKVLHYGTLTKRFGYKAEDAATIVAEANFSVKDNMGVTRQRPSINEAYQKAVKEHGTQITATAAELADLKVSQGHGKWEEVFTTALEQSRISTQVVSVLADSDDYFNGKDIFIPRVPGLTVHSNEEVAAAYENHLNQATALGASMVDFMAQRFGDELIIHTFTDNGRRSSMSYQEFMQQGPTSQKAREQSDAELSEISSLKPRSLTGQPEAASLLRSKVKGALNVSAITKEQAKELKAQINAALYGKPTGHSARLKSRGSKDGQ